MDIIKKIQTRGYKSETFARAAVKRSGHSAADKKRLMRHIDEAYAVKPDGLNETVDVGKPVVSVDIRSAYPMGLESELTVVAFRMLAIMVKHKLSREEAFDRLKETLMAGMG